MCAEDLISADHNIAKVRPYETGADSSDNSREQALGKYIEAARRFSSDRRWEEQDKEKGTDSIKADGTANCTHYDFGEGTHLTYAKENVSMAIPKAARVAGSLKPFSS